MTQYFTDIDQTATAHGFTLTATLEPDHDHGAPWDEDDGHGPVSDWRRASMAHGYARKAPGELILCEDHGSARFYDYAAAVRIALRDGWGISPYKQTVEHSGAMNGLRRLCTQWFIGSTLHTHETAWTDELDHSDYRAAQDTIRDSFPSARAYAAAAARANYDRLRAWCNDEWHYMGVIVTASRNGIELGSASLWGIESDCTDYLLEVANELAPDAISDARATLESLA